MKVLHLFANHKLTGPAELALDTADSVFKRGLDVSFYSSDVTKTEFRDRHLQILARKKGVPDANLEGVRLPKHISPLRAFLDVRALRGHLRANRPDVIHCHLPGDHLVAGLASKPLGIPIVRSLYDGTPPKPTPRTRLMFSKHTHALICHSTAVAEHLTKEAAAYSLDPARIHAMPPPIDVTRFDPAREVPTRREELEVPTDAFCLGIVARMQTHRRFEVLLRAIKIARQDVPGLHLVVVGRGTNQDAVARKPVEALGLSDCVHFSGYLRGEEYVGTLASFDAKVFMVPGSDGTCRAVREALALGVPVVTTKRGMLGELVRQGIDGLNVDETAEALAAAFCALANDSGRLAKMSEAARAGAVERFAFDRLATALEALYGEATREDR
jgi:glycosyltransferase involved in cell wall biosynthesis